MLLICSKLNLGKFQDSTKELLRPILRVQEKAITPLLGQFSKNLQLNCLVPIIVVPIFRMGKVIYSVGSSGQWVG